MTAARPTESSTSVHRTPPPSPALAALRTSLIHSLTLLYQLALPPSSFVEVSQRLKKNNYSTDVTNRLVVEKPFGKDTKTCKEMMGKITADWKETEIYRIDHYLGASLSPPCLSLLHVDMAVG